LEQLVLTPPPNFLAEHPRNASDGEDGAWGGHAQAARARAVSFAQFHGEEPGLAAQSQATLRPLGGVVGETDAAVLEEAGERGPAFEHVVHGAGQLAVAIPRSRVLSDTSA